MVLSTDLFQLFLSLLFYQQLQTVILETAEVFLFQICFFFHQGLFLQYNYIQAPDRELLQYIICLFVIFFEFVLPICHRLSVQLFFGPR